MKNVTFFIVFMCVAVLMSCGHFHGTNVSVWAGGFWLVPWLSGAGAAIFWWLAYRSHRSKSEQQQRDGSWKEFDSNVSIWSIGFTYFAVALTVTCIGVIIYANSGWWK